MRWLAPHRTPAHVLDDKINAAMAAGKENHAKVSAIVALSQAEEAGANELAEQVRHRLERLESRREERKQDQRVAVVINTIRIMERPN